MSMEESDNSLWLASLNRLHDIFADLAKEYNGVQLFLVREPFEDGHTPVHNLVNQHLATNSLTGIIGHQADGIISTHAGQISSYNEFYMCWFIHERFRRARDQVRFGNYYSNEFLTEQSRARECEERYDEIAQEASRLYISSKTEITGFAEDLNAGQRVSATSIFWTVLLFRFALMKPKQSTIEIGFLNPRIVEVDIFEACSSAKIHDHVIYQMNTNPFLASAILTSHLLHLASTPQQRPMATSGTQLDRSREDAESRSAELEDVEQLVPTVFQREILKALEGRALTKQKLSLEVCGGDGSRLYKKNGIKELMDTGLVSNKRGLGYFRPDKPPPMD